MIALLIWGYIRLNTKISTRQPRVTVLVAAHNEQDVIGDCINSLVSQNYPADKTQIIIIDDRSSDDTEIILEQLSQQHSILEILRVNQGEKSASPKKNALALGIGNASGEIILTTDADCQPPSGWVSTMVACFAPDTGLVAGLSPLKPAKTWSGILLSMDAIFNMGVAAGGIGWGVGITCTGRNLAFRKQAFEEVGGYSKIAHSLSGDDDLLLQLISRETDWGIKYCKDRKASVLSSTKESFSEHIRQRMRHTSAAVNYTQTLQSAFLLHAAMNIILFILPVLALYLHINVKLAVYGLLLKIIIDAVLLLLPAIRTRQAVYILLTPFWEMWQFFNLVIVNPLGLIVKPRWR